MSYEEEDEGGVQADRIIASGDMKSNKSGGTGFWNMFVAFRGLEIPSSAHCDVDT